MKAMTKQNQTSKRNTATDISTLSCEKSHEVLEVGKVYTYKELCTLLEQNRYKTKDQKNAQLKTFKRFFDFDEDIDGDYIITEIYDEMQPKLPRETRSDSYYSQYIQYLLLNVFNEKQDNTIIMTSKQWWLYLGFMKQKYFYIKNIKDNEQDENNELQTEVGYTGSLDIAFIKTDLDEFYSRTGQKFYHIFYDALKSLTDRRFIHVTTIYMVGSDWDHLHEANDDEIELCLKSDRKAIEELNKWLLETRQINKSGKIINIEKKSQIIYQSEKVKNKFYNLSNKYIKELGGWSVCYKATKIVFTKQGVDAAIKQAEKKIQEKQNVMFTLNKNIVNQLNKQLLKNNNIIWDLDEFYTDTILEDERIKNNKNLCKQLVLTEKLVDISK